MYAGDAYRSPTLGAWVRVTPRGVVLSEDRAGEKRWLTHEESGRSEREARLTAQAAERRAREAQADLEQRVRQLEEQLARKP